MTWIKICGTTNLHDALLAVEAGADALGFVFHNSSPRKVDPELVREIVASLPPKIEKVGVFVDQSPKQIADIAEYNGLSAIQFYSSPAGNFPVSKTSCKLFLAVSAATLAERSQQLQDADQSIDALFIDSGKAEKPGGTGKPFDWIEAAPALSSLRDRYKIVIAGGLNPDNVTQAIRILNPWGVDVVSGVEAAPGRKDPEKLRAFIAAVRAAKQSDANHFEKSRP